MCSCRTGSQPDHFLVEGLWTHTQALCGLTAFSQMKGFVERLGEKKTQMLHKSHLFALWWRLPCLHCYISVIEDTSWLRVVLIKDPWRNRLVTYPVFCKADVLHSHMPRQTNHHLILRRRSSPLWTLLLSSFPKQSPRGGKGNSDRILCGWSLGVIGGGPAVEEEGFLLETNWNNLVGWTWKALKFCAASEHSFLSRCCAIFCLLQAPAETLLLLLLDWAEREVGTLHKEDGITCKWQLWKRNPKGKC